MSTKGKNNQAKPECKDRETAFIARFLEITGLDKKHGIEAADGAALIQDARAALNAHAAMETNFRTAN